ncbi:glycosyltransferase family 4 protein [Anaerocolumna xylanovorans]|uniref:1,2-diacylglycerol 3-alpha-glucosyltransferase n=1 Tax=Anaerocolumna xylanovorans DSM 12503 TaxID=1121345 RepID=A0A1M7Y8G3_9FIRM|nr:glycosyltransferase family 4 protein [Anaerocolumna xylanovorans]SHO48861.1 1,2-diacylglycerol 3-alpha-glucosyltransferase [Anaerocolumna xylanovorans DSM 12503]
MNIGLFTETYYPEINGVANSVFILKRELETLGHTVYVFTTTTPGAPEYEYNVFRVPSLPFILITERRIGMFYQPKLAGTIKKLNLDIIHTHTEFSLGIFGRIMAKELKIPMIHTYHTIYEDYTHYLTHFKSLDGRAKAFARIFTKVCCNTVAHVIVPTEKVRELLQKYSVHRDISVIPTGVDLKKFDPFLYQPEEIKRLKGEYSIGKEEKVILYVGRVSREKNIIEIVNAMEGYMKERKTVKFLVIGGGPEMDELRSRTRALKLEDRIIFAGAKPWDKIGLYYQLGDVFVSASKSETQGLTYIEAMAAGLPAVAKEDDCLNDILIDGVNGYKFNNKEELMSGLDKVLFADKITPYGENARKLMQKFSTEAFGKSVEAVYAEVLEERHSSEQTDYSENKKINYLF